MPDATNTAITEMPTKIRLLSIDAWREPDGCWTWNNWYKIADVPLEWCDLSARKLLQTLRQEGYLRASSAGRCAIEDDGHNVTILDRRNGRPVIALEYGPACL